MNAIKHKSLHSLAETVAIFIDRGEFNPALKLIHDVVEQIVTEPLCTSQVFGSKILDNLCQSIGRASLAAINRESVHLTQNPPLHPVHVYVVTKFQKSGGHSRVIEDFIRALPSEQHVILSTELSGRSDTDYLLSRFGKHANIVFEAAPNLSCQQRLTWLQSRLLHIQAKKVYLFNHHQDSVAVAAIQPDMKLDASFYHHGDHHLCLGVYLSHLEHIDPHPMGYHNCRDLLDIDNVYMPLTVDDKGLRPDDWTFLRDGKLTTCTAARSNKIEIPYFVNYLELVPKLIAATGGRHIHIGRLTPWALFKIRRGLKRYGILSDQFIYTPWVPSVWNALHEYRVDLYVASFPYGGGLTLLEAMGAGIPVALHKHIFSRVLSGIDLAYPEVFSWRYPDELLKYCATVTRSDLGKASLLGRMQYEKFHLPENLRKILADESQARPLPNDLSDKFSVDSDEWALWMTRQMNVRGLLSRAAYRTLRRFRVWLFENIGR